jgi:hypothetical protein
MSCCHRTDLQRSALADPDGVKGRQGSGCLEGWHHHRPWQVKGFQGGLQQLPPNYNAVGAWKSLRACAPCVRIKPLLLTNRRP